MPTTTPGTSPSNSVAGSPPERESFVKKLAEQRGIVGFEKTTDDIADRYDHYYKRADKTDPRSALYNSRFGKDRVLIRESALIKESVQWVVSRLPAATAESPLTLRLLDIGAGDGRLFPVFKELAAELKDQNIHIELLAFEPSYEGLSNFQTDLKQLHEFEYTGDNLLHPIVRDESGENGYKAATMRKDNLSVTFIHNHVDDTLAHNASLIGDVHFSMAMFGVMAHMPTKEKREAFTAMLYNQTLPGGEILINVPTPLMFSDEQIAYDVFRKQKRPVGKATGKRDIYYCKFAKEIEEAGNSLPVVDNYYHIFSAKELWKLVEKAGFEITENVKASSIGHPAEISQNLEENIRDAASAARISQRYSRIQTLAKRSDPLQKIESHCHYISLTGSKPSSTGR